MATPILTLLARARAAGLEFLIDGDGFTVEGEPDAGEALADEICAHRDEILTELRREACLDAWTATVDEIARSRRNVDTFPGDEDRYLELMGEAIRAGDLDATRLHADAWRRRWHYRPPEGDSARPVREWRCHRCGEPASPHSVDEVLSGRAQCTRCDIRQQEEEDARRWQGVDLSEPPPPERIEAGPYAGFLASPTDRKPCPNRAEKCSSDKKPQSKTKGGVERS